ncbi:hypothetical protein [Marinicella sp. W31]|uniref:hypothetical protein n=1 Tax=Marinicella sp. W31 TaxID=3023713 RepID=UPI0037565744
MNSIELTNEFEQCSIQAHNFGHHDHIAVAYELLKKYDFLKVIEIYSRCIKTIAGHAGVPDKFNLTLTLAFLSVIAERMEKDQEPNFVAFIRTNEDLLRDNPLNKYYSKKRLSSERARHYFLLPDVIPGK